MKLQQSILSLVYKDRIEKLCNNIRNTCDFKYFVCYIMFNNGKSFVISNMYNMLSEYYDHLYKEDYSYEKEFTSDLSFYLCNYTKSISKNFSKILEERCNIFRAFYIIRNCPECQFIFGAIKDKRILDFQYVYKDTVGKFEDFCCYFVDNIIDIIKFHNQNYFSSIVLNDPLYRTSIIKEIFNKKLTAREIDCLFLAAQGNSSEETAEILKIKKNTVEDYRSNVKNKLNSANMAQAVYEGIRHGYLGNFNNVWTNPSTY